MLKFTVYVRRKTKDKAIRMQELEWHFLRIKDALHYAIDKFDLKKDDEMIICKADKIIMTLQRR